MCSNIERADEVQAFARVLMGLSHPIQIVGQARAVDLSYDWTQPPRIARRWLAVIAADESNMLDWRVRTLRAALEGVGLHTEEVTQDEYCAPAPRDIWVDSMRDGDGWCATLVLRRWPREIAPGWLGNALAMMDTPCDLAIHVIPQDAARLARFLKRQSSWQDDGGRDAANELGRRDAHITRQKMIAHTDRPVRVAIAFTVHAPTQAELTVRVATLRHELGLTLSDVRLAKYEQDRGRIATLPTGECELLGAYHTLDCTSVALTWPFQPATIGHAHGAAIGTTGGMLVKLNPFDLSLRSFGGLITGSVGSGKSFLLKLILLGLDDVETWVVEQSEPTEYEGIPGVHWFTLADMSQAQQAEQLRKFVSNLWDTARREPRPRLLVLDELWSLLKRPELADLVEEIARRGRKYYLSLWIATQQIEELLDSAKAVFDNAAIRVFLQQEDRDLGGLAKAARLSDAGRQYLRGAGRGQALLYVNGMLIPLDVQATHSQYHLINTDPREVHRGLDNTTRKDGADSGQPPADRLGSGSGGSSAGRALALALQ